MKRMNGKIKFGFLFLPLFIGGVFLFTWGLMALWNGILPEVTGVKTISFWQAMGIFALSKILFGFGGSWGGKRSRWRERREKYNNMPPEEWDKIKSEWKNRCGGRWGTSADTTPSAP